MFCSQCGTKNEDTARFCTGCGHPLAPATVSQATAAEVPPGPTSTAAPRYAGFWYRTLAYVIDVVITMVIAMPIVMPLAFALGASMAETATPEAITAAGEALGNAMGVLVSWLYFTISESSAWQATLGKRLLGLKVTDEAGQRIGFGRANGRYWSNILSALLLMVGFLMIAFTAKKQGLHDKIAGTLVDEGQLRHRQALAGRLGPLFFPVIAL